MLHLKQSIRFVTAFLLLLLITSYRSSPKSFETEIDRIIATEFKDKNGPGGVFLVTKNGKPIYRKAIGKANIELGVDLTPEFVFQIGSMTKQFTAIATLILEEQGKLNVMDTLSKYLPDYPGGNKITIHHLLTHTSGIKDFTKMKTLRDIAQKEMTPEQMVDFFKNEPVDFLPGEKFDYNNSGYVVLGYLIEKVSGETYEAFVKKNIFDKAGMSQSGYASDRKIIKNRAYGYHEKEYGYVNKTVINFSVPFSSGALISTVDDMFKWQQALNNGTLLRTENSRKAFTKYRLNSGEEFTYGYGWHLRDINGIATREHGGSVFGYKSMGVYVPEEDIYVIGFSNCDCHSPTKIVQDIAKSTLEHYRKKK